MKLSPLSAISPVDGRYHSQTTKLSTFFSEGALIRYRVRVEIEYFIALCRLPLPQLSEVTPAHIRQLQEIPTKLTDSHLQEIKDTEKITNHDVKAVEYFVKKQLENLGLNNVSEFVHFGLTSQDINNTSMPMMFMDAVGNIYNPALDALITRLAILSDEWIDIAMLARTHGQPASPTKLGKEFKVFHERLEVQFRHLSTLPHSAKFGGATGNFNAHHIAYPHIDWEQFANDFLRTNLGLSRQRYTTQIEHYDGFAAYCDGMKRINTILIDLCRDVWSYIAMDYFKQRIKEGEIGSSAMPHKINPIDFENAEGNLGIANALLAHLSEKLPISRLQRDLTDSTVMRNVGVPMAHTLIALSSIMKGLDKLIVNKNKIESDLKLNWAVVAEAIQTILRREKYPQPYEALKLLTRTGNEINKETIHLFVESLNINEKVKKELKAITPHNYTGIF